MENVIITPGNELRCPICNRKVGKLTGNEVIINFKMRCPRKINGAAHEFIINVNAEEAEQYV